MTGSFWVNREFLGEGVNNPVMGGPWRHRDCNIVHGGVSIFVDQIAVSRRA